MKSGRMGCCFIYSVALIVVGMGLYKYRAEVIDFIAEKYHETIAYVSDKSTELKDSTSDKIDEIKNK